MTVYLRAEAGEPATRLRAEAAAGERLTVTVRSVSGGAVRGALTDVRQRTSYGDRRVDGTARFTASQAGPPTWTWPSRPPVPAPACTP
jgi:hypothetical protein